MSNRRIFLNLKNENYNEVIKICKLEGDKNADAQIVLAYCYALGLGVAENDAKAVELLQKALGRECELNHIGRSMLVFYRLAGGNGVEQNLNFACELLRKGGTDFAELRGAVQEMLNTRESYELYYGWGTIQAKEYQEAMEQTDFKILYKDWKTWMREGETMQAYIDAHLD